MTGLSKHIFSAKLSTAPAFSWASESNSILWHCAVLISTPLTSIQCSFMHYHKWPVKNLCFFTITPADMCCNSPDTVSSRNMIPVCNGLPRHHVLTVPNSEYVWLSTKTRRSQWLRGLRPLACWDCGFESHQRHGCLSVVGVMCCRVEVSATSWSLIQRSPTDCGASLCVI